MGGFDPHAVKLAVHAWLDTPAGQVVTWTVDSCMVAIWLFVIARGIYLKREAFKALRTRAYWIASYHGAAAAWRAQDAWTKCVQGFYAILFGSMILMAIGRAIVNALSSGAPLPLPGGLY